ncbi:MAG: hypothetical protein U9N42_08245, partial [Campylobacterota bacterium]|nr:hypothetical protein [Campylobacterota bacterium]
MQTRLIIFIVIALIFFISSLFIQSVAQKDASNTTTKFESQLHLVNLSSSLKYEIQSHRSSMLESLILSNKNIHVHSKLSNVKLIIDELKVSPSIKDKIELKDIIKTVELRYDSFLNSEKNLLKMSKNRDIEEIQGAIFAYNSITAKFA